MMLTTASRPVSRRRVGAVAVAALALAAVLVPGVAEAAGEFPGGLTPETAVPVALNTSFPGSNLAATSVGSGSTATGALPLSSAVVWYSFTTTVPGTVNVRTSDILNGSSGYYDTTLELWTDAGTFVGYNDDHVAAPRVPVDLASHLVSSVTPGAYLLGLGGFGAGDKGTATVSLTFTPAVPSTPTGLQAAPADEVATVTWDPMLPAWEVTRYDLTCTVDGGLPYGCGGTAAPGPGAPAPTALDLTGLTNGSVYTVSVTATNPSGTSDPSAPVAFTPQVVSATTVTVAPSSLVSGESFVVMASAADVSDSSPITVGSFTVTVDGTPVPDADPGPNFVSAPLTHLAGPMAVEAVYSGTAAVRGSTGSASVTVGQQVQTLTMPALPTDLVFGDVVAPVASSSHGLPVTFAAAGACAMTTDAVPQLRMTGVGTCELSGSQAGTSEVTAATGSVSAMVAQAPQIITVSPLADLVFGTTQPVAATSDAGLAVAVSASGACTLTDGVLSTVAVGECTVTATQAGDTNYLPAAPVTVALDVTKRPDTVTLSDLPALISGVARVPVTATSGHGLPVTITGSGSCMVVDGDVVTMDVGTCTVTAATAGDEVTEAASDSAVVEVFGVTASVSAQLLGGVGADADGLRVRGDGAGLRPGTPLVLTVYSSPQAVGAVTATRTGTAVVDSVLPDLADGTHRLVATGTALDGTEVSGQVAFGVEDGAIIWVGVPPRLATTGPGLDGAGALAALWLLTGACLVLARNTALRRRRLLPA